MCVGCSVVSRHVRNATRRKRRKKRTSRSREQKRDLCPLSGSRSRLVLDRTVGVLARRHLSAWASQCGLSEAYLGLSGLIRIVVCVCVAIAASDG